MGGKGRGKTGHGKAWKKPSQEEEKAKRTYLAAVKPEWALAKNSLRPYASEDSSPFFTGGKSDTKYWELGRIREAMAADTAELANRLGIALSESGGTICMGADVLKTFASGEEGLEKLGFRGAATLLGGDGGLRDAANVLNKYGTPVARGAPELRLAAETLLDFLEDDPAGKAKTFQRVARSAAKLYLLAVDLLQWLAAAEDKKKWAAKFEDGEDLQPRAVQAWLAKPKDRAKLLAALVASHEAQVKTQKANARGSSESDEAAQEESATSSSNSKAKKDKKKKKKSKKDKKNKQKKAAEAKGKSSEDGGEGTSKAEKKKKRKRTEAKKSKKRSSSSSSSSSPSKETALLAELEEAAPDPALICWRESDVALALAGADQLATQPITAETLDQLKGLFALIPDEVQTSKGLRKIQAAVKAMGKAPARAALNKIAGRAREVAEAAEALHAAHAPESRPSD
ncbi:unnamed protein product [Effrenium voratum]|uniref:Uncharacterized protein n=1 Tax=Effrenium voratum TaxID=2562239 RepID=A0AA36ITH6_9DINO|nr:unnamed protein product [Effrenium voratum]